MIDLPTFPSIPSHHVPGYDKNKNGSLSYSEKASWYYDYKSNSPKILKLDYNHTRRQLRTSEAKLKGAEKQINSLTSANKGYENTRKLLIKSNKSLIATKAQLKRANAMTIASNVKYDAVSETMEKMQENLSSLHAKYQSTVNQLNSSMQRNKQMLANKSIEGARFAAYKAMATSQARDLNRKVSGLEKEIESANREVTTLLTKIEEIEKNEELSLSQAVMDVRDTAFNTAFPNLGGISETQSRGLAFFTGLLLVGFMVGRIE